MSIVSVLRTTGVDQRHHSLCVFKILSIKLNFLLAFWSQVTNEPCTNWVGSTGYLENKGNKSFG